LFTQNLSLADQNSSLKQKSGKISAMVSKEKVVAALNKRGIEIDDRSRQTEK